jgi:hypothetical protein
VKTYGIFLQSQGLRETAMQLLGELELLRLLDQFYDRAVYYAMFGYESASREPQPVAVSVFPHSR